jgi:hypothetical protein
LSVLAASLVTCLLLGIITALAFTLFTTGLVLIFVLPTVFIGSCTASFLFLWGLAGYLILQRLNGGEMPVKRGTTVGDKLNGLTGGRLHHLADGPDESSHEKRMAVDSTSHSKAVNGRAGRDDHRRAPNWGGDARVNASEKTGYVNGDERAVDWKTEFGS